MRRTRPRGATQETLIEAIATSVPTITGQKASEIEQELRKVLGNDEFERSRRTLANDATALAEIAGRGSAGTTRGLIGEN